MLLLEVNKRQLRSATESNVYKAQISDFGIAPFCVKDLFSLETPGVSEYDSMVSKARQIAITNG